MSVASSLLGSGPLRLKGNCHCHSTYSDGAHPPDETVGRYRAAGYDFLFLTEHCDKLTNGEFPDFGVLDSPDFRVLPGVEYRNTTHRGGRERMAMILGLGTLEVDHWRPGLDQQSTIDAINQDGGLAVLSCTVWDGRVAGDMLNLEGVSGIEIYNATCEGSVNKGFALTHWDALLESGMRLNGLAVDDTHFSEWPDFGLGWIVVSAKDRTPPSIVEGLRTGVFYSSCGPEIKEWSIQGSRIRFRCSPVEKIVYSGVGPWGRVVRMTGEGLLTELTLDFELDCRPEMTFIRFSCCDTDGCWAWTNPVWLSDIVS